MKKPSRSPAFRLSKYARLNLLVAIGIFLVLVLVIWWYKTRIETIEIKMKGMDRQARVFLNLFNVNRSYNVMFLLHDRYALDTT